MADEMAFEMEEPSGRLSHLEVSSRMAAPSGECGHCCQLVATLLTQRLEAAEKQLKECDARLPAGREAAKAEATLRARVSQLEAELREMDDARRDAERRREAAEAAHDPDAAAQRDDLRAEKEALLARVAVLEEALDGMTAERVREKREAEAARSDLEAQLAARPEAPDPAPSNALLARIAELEDELREGGKREDAALEELEAALAEKDAALATATRKAAEQDELIAALRAELASAERSANSKSAHAAAEAEEKERLLERIKALEKMIRDVNAKLLAYDPKDEESKEGTLAHWRKSTPHYVPANPPQPRVRHVAAAEREPLMPRCGSAPGPRCELRADTRSGTVVVAERGRRPADAHARDPARDLYPRRHALEARFAHLNG